MKKDIKYRFAYQLHVMACQYVNLMSRAGLYELLKKDPYLADTNKLLKDNGYDFLMIDSLVLDK